MLPAQASPQLVNLTEFSRQAGASDRRTVRIFELSVFHQPARADISNSVVDESVKLRRASALFRHYRNAAWALEASADTHGAPIASA